MGTTVRSENEQLHNKAVKSTGRGRHTQNEIYWILVVYYVVAKTCNMWNFYTVLHHNKQKKCDLYKNFCVRKLFVYCK